MKFLRWGVFADCREGRKYLAKDENGTWILVDEKSKAWLSPTNGALEADDMVRAIHRREILPDEINWAEIFMVEEEW